VLNRADPMHLNAHGLTAAMAAALGGNPRTVSLLIKLTTDEVRVCVCVCVCVRVCVSVYICKSEYIHIYTHMYRRDKVPC
jgi:Na+-translocating ferredoxin:NAD+ oxidoreductase RnfE subunit